MTIYQHIVRFVFRPRHLYDLGPMAYAGRVDGQQVMLMLREDGLWYYFINTAEAGSARTPRAAEAKAIKDIRNYFGRVYA